MAVSPDGSRLAFVRGFVQLFVIELDGSQERSLAVTPGIRGLTWTADGKSIVFATMRSSGNNLWKIAASGRGRAELIRRGVRRGCISDLIARRSKAGVQRITTEYQYLAPGCPRRCFSCWTCSFGYKADLFDEIAILATGIARWPAHRIRFGPVGKPQNWICDPAAKRSSADFSWGPSYWHAAMVT